MTGMSAGPGLAGIEEHAALAIATNENRSCFAHRRRWASVRGARERGPPEDDYLEETHLFIFEQVPVEGGSRDHRVQFVGP